MLPAIRCCQSPGCECRSVGKPRVHVRALVLPYEAQTATPPDAPCTAAVIRRRSRDARRGVSVARCGRGGGSRECVGVGNPTGLGCRACYMSPVGRSPCCGATTYRGGGGRYVLSARLLCGAEVYCRWRSLEDVSTMRSLGGRGLGPWRRQRIGRPRSRYWIHVALWLPNLGSRLRVGPEATAIGQARNFVRSSMCRLA